MRSYEQEAPLFVGRNDAERIREKIEASRTVLLRDESFNGWPVWAVPATFGEVVAVEPLRPETSHAATILWWRLLFTDAQELPMNLDFCGSLAL